MYDYMKPLLWKEQDYIILHIGTKDAFDNTSRKTFEKNLKLKMYIGKELPKYKITISTPINQHDHRKASLTILHLSQTFKDLSISFVYNFSIGAFSLSSDGLHLNDKDSRRLAINLRPNICKLWYELEPINDDHDKKC